MTNSKKILVTSATRETFVIKRGGKNVAVGAFCADCQAETELLDLNLAAVAYRLKMREIIHRIETGAVHSAETADGQMHVCRNSLENSKKTKEKIK